MSRKRGHSDTNSDLDLEGASASASASADGTVRARKRACVGAVRTVLRPSQERALVWLERTLAAHAGAVLALRMGAGKSLLVIRAIERLFNARPDAPPVLILVSVTGYGVWREQLLHASPGFRAEFYFADSGTGAPPARCIAVVASYDALASQRGRTLLTVAYSVLFVDEGHLLRNEATRRRVAADCVCAERRVVLSGTPVQNYVRDVISLALFCRWPPFVACGSLSRCISAVAAQPELLFDALQTIFVRDAASDAHDIVLHRYTIAMPFGAEERAAYMAVLEHAGEHACNALVLRMLSLSFCANSEVKRDMVCYYMETKYTRARRAVFFSGSIAQQGRVAHLLTTRYALRVGTMFGRHTPAERAATTAAWATGAYDALVVSFRIAALSVNLQHAGDVVIIDMNDANPANYAQAEARVHRPGVAAHLATCGGPCAVRVYYLVVPGTLDAHVRHLHDAKTRIAQALMRAVPTTEYAPARVGEARAALAEALAAESERRVPYSAGSLSLHTPRHVEALLGALLGRTSRVDLGALINSYNLDTGVNDLHLRTLNAPRYDQEAETESAAAAAPPAAAPLVAHAALRTITAGTLLYLLAQPPHAATFEPVPGARVRRASCDLHVVHVPAARTHAALRAAAAALARYEGSGPVADAALALRTDATCIGVSSAPGIALAFNPAWAATQRLDELLLPLPRSSRRT